MAQYRPRTAGLVVGKVAQAASAVNAAKVHGETLLRPRSSGDIRVSLGGEVGRRGATGFATRPASGAAGAVSASVLFEGLDIASGDALDAPSVRPYGRRRIVGLKRSRRVRAAYQRSAWRPGVRTLAHGRAGGSEGSHGEARKGGGTRKGDPRLSHLQNPERCDPG